MQFARSEMAVWQMAYAAGVEMSEPALARESGCVVDVAVVQVQAPPASMLVHVGTFLRCLVAELPWCVQVPLLSIGKLGHLGHKFVADIR